MERDAAQTWQHRAGSAARSWLHKLRQTMNIYDVLLFEISQCNVGMIRTAGRAALHCAVRCMNLVFINQNIFIETKQQISGLAGRAPAPRSNMPTFYIGNMFLH